MIGGGILVLGIVGFIVMKKLKKNKQMEVDSGSGSGSGMGSGSGTNMGSGMGSGTPSMYNSFEDRKILYKAMKGAGTNEKAIYDVVNKLSSAQRVQLKNDWNNNIGMYDGETLCDWIKGDFSNRNWYGAKTNEEDKMLANFGC